MGLVPAVRASRVALVPSLAQPGKGIAGPSGTVVRHAIVVAQMALATMLLVGAALLLQSFVRLQHVRLGFDPDGVITARVSLPGAQYPDAARTGAFWRQLLESLAGMPQVQSVAIGMTAPFGPGVRAGGTARSRGDGRGDRGRGAHRESGLPSGPGYTVAGRPCVRSTGRTGVAPGRDRQRERRSTALGRQQPGRANARLEWATARSGWCRGRHPRRGRPGLLRRRPGSRAQYRGLPVRDPVPAEDDDVAGADHRRAVRDRTGDCSRRTRYRSRTTGLPDPPPARLARREHGAAAVHDER